jgi:UrcA family protein
MLIKHKNNSTGSRFGVNTIITAAISTGLLFAAVPANAYIPHKKVVSVKFSAADLQSEAGIQRVYEFLTIEASTACKTNGPTSLVDRRQNEECASALLEDFVESVNDVRLNDYHEQQLAS